MLVNKKRGKNSTFCRFFFKIEEVIWTWAYQNLCIKSIYWSPSLVIKFAFTPDLPSVQNLYFFVSIEIQSERKPINLFLSKIHVQYLIAFAFTFIAIFIVRIVKGIVFVSVLINLPQLLWSSKNGCESRHAS